MKISSWRIHVDVDRNGPFKEDYNVQAGELLEIRLQDLVNKGQEVISVMYLGCRRPDTPFDNPPKTPELVYSYQVVHKPKMTINIGSNV